MRRLIDADELKTAFPPGESVKTECVRATIDHMSTVELEPHWIPVSERLPEEDGFYYVTEQNYGCHLDADVKQRVAHTSHFRDGDFIDRLYTENYSNVVAYIKLPEPYKARGGIMNTSETIAYAIRKKMQ